MNLRIFTRFNLVVDVSQFISGGVFPGEDSWLSQESKFQKLGKPIGAADLVDGTNQKSVVVVKVHVPNFITEGKFQRKFGLLFQV